MAEKGVKSPERQLDEAAFFLHRVVADLPPAKQAMLKRRGMTVLTATTGTEAISVINADPTVAFVLMDIMMPGMDGYETMQVMRSNAVLRRLPIIPLTAEAMKGDRERCLEAGASDYLAKPVNTEQLLAALRMGLHR